MLPVDIYCHEVIVIPVPGHPLVENHIQHGIVLAASLEFCQTSPVSSFMPPCHHFHVICLCFISMLFEEFCNQVGEHLLCIRDRLFLLPHQSSMSETCVGIHHGSIKGSYIQVENMAVVLPLMKDCPSSWIHFRYIQMGTEIMTLFLELLNSVSVAVGCNQ